MTGKTAKITTKAIIKTKYNKEIYWLRLKSMFLVLCSSIWKLQFEDMRVTESSYDNIVPVKYHINNKIFI